jgi:hypothetical protein
MQTMDKIFIQAEINFSCFKAKYKVLCIFEWFVIREKFG